MKIRLYQFIGENNRVDKSGEMSLLGEISGNLREASDVLNPVITFITKNQSDIITASGDDVTDAEGNDVVLPILDPAVNISILTFLFLSV